MMTDIEIAQSVTPRHILEIAKDAGIDEKYIELYGRSKANVYLANFDSLRFYYTLRLFGGRHPLCGIGVTSLIKVISSPAA